HLCGMSLAVEEDVALDPVDVRLLGAAAVVPGSEGVSHPIEQAWLRVPRGRSFPCNERSVSDRGHRYRRSSRETIAATTGERQGRSGFQLIGHLVGGFTPLRTSTPRLSSRIRAITSSSSMVLTWRCSITILPSTMTVSTLPPDAEYTRL